MTRVIADTGPLVALLNPRDAYHGWARDTIKRSGPAMLTCEAVLIEAAFLVRRGRGGPAAVLGLVARNVVEVGFRVDAEILALRTLVERYASIPMSLADACLVRMAELNPGVAVLTLDGHFRIYRRAGRLAIPVIMPG